jgi:hypothetical protein
MHSSDPLRFCTPSHPRPNPSSTKISKRWYRFKKNLPNAPTPNPINKIPSTPSPCPPRRNADRCRDIHNHMCTVCCPPIDNKRDRRYSKDQKQNSKFLSCYHSSYKLALRSTPLAPHRVCEQNLKKQGQADLTTVARIRGT